MSKQLELLASKVARALDGQDKTGELIHTIEDWFYSDFDIEFILEDDDGRQLLCTFESDCYYFEGKRFKGDHRRIILVEGSDEIYEAVLHLTGKLYTKQELKEVVDELAYRYQISWPEETNVWRI